MSSKLVCDIVTPEAKLYSEEAYMVTVPGIEGEMGYLQDHEPLVSILADGVARIQKEKDAEMQRFVLQGGYVEVTGKKVIILADRARVLSDIDLPATKAEMVGLEDKLADLPEEDVKRLPLETEIDWCKIQISALEK